MPGLTLSSPTSPGTGARIPIVPRMLDDIVAIHLINIGLVGLLSRRTG